MSNGPDIIEPSSSSIGTISLLSALPALTRGEVTIEDLDIDGSQAGSGANGLQVEANGIALVGLGITNFGASGVLVFGDQTLITGSTITGNSGAIDIFGASGNTIGGTGAGQGNVISGSAGDGIYAGGTGMSDNLIEGNTIGTDASGTTARPNGLWGVFLGDTGPGNTIGGSTPGAGNVISGNGEGGVAIYGIDATGDVVQGNLIGTDITGTQPLGNGFSGVYVGDWGNTGDGASDATIGGTTPGAGNVISDNGNWGVWISGAGVTGVVVQGNLIGTDASGSKALGNTWSGIQIDRGASNNTIGGAAAGAGNIISANGQYGIEVTGQGTTGNVVAGNQIGTTTVGGNTFGGVFVTDEAAAVLGSANTISGTVLINDGGSLDITGSSNLISGTVRLSLGGGSSSGSGVLKVTGPANSITGGLYVNGGVLTISGTSLEVTGPDTLLRGSISAASGGSLSLSGLTSLNNASSLSFSANGPGSSLNISNLSSFSGTGISITEINGAELSMDDSFTTLDGVSFTIDNTSDLANLLINNLTSLTDGGLTVLGGKYAFSKLTDIDGSSLDVENGASLSLPGVTSETNSAGVNYGLPFFANGGSTLDLHNLTMITGDGVNVAADGTGSTINLSSLTTFDVNPAGGALSASDGGTIDLNANLTTINGANVYIDATSTITPLAQLTALTGGTFTINGVDDSNAFPNLANINGLGILVEGGGSLSLPLVASYTNNGYPFSESLQVQGSNSTLSLVNLATITGNGVSIVASGTGSLIDVSGLTSFGTYNEGLSVTDGATVDLNPNLTSIDNLYLTLDGTGNLPIGQFTSLTGGSITIEGGNYTSSGPSWFSSLTDIDGTSVYVSGGGDLVLGVTSYTNYWDTTFQVSGTNSVLDLSTLTTIDGTGGSMTISASGTGSEIDLSALSSLDTPRGGTLSVTQDATILDGSLTTLDNVTVQLDGTGKLATRQWTSLTDGELSILGGKYSSPTSGTSSASFANLTDINGSGLYVSNGILTLPGVTSYNSEERYITFSASGSGAVLSLPQLGNVQTSGSSSGLGSGTGTGTGIGAAAVGGYGNDLNFKATSGGQVLAPALTSIYDDDYASVGAQAIGDNSLVNLSAVTSFGTYDGTIEALQGGTVDLSSLTSLESVSITVDGSSTLLVGQLATLNYSNLTITGGTFDDATLTNIDNTSLYVSGGAVLTLPSITSYANDEYYYGTTFGATDTTAGGVISLPGLTMISGTYGVNIDAAGSQSEIDLHALTTLSSSYYYYYQNSLSVTQGATIDDGGLTNLTDVRVTLDGTGKLAVRQWTSLTNGNLTITGGDYAPTTGAASADNSFAKLTDIDGSGLYVSGGGSLSLPGVTSYTNNEYNYDDDSFQVTDTTAGGILSLPNLTTIGGSYAVQIEAAGSSSQIDLPKLTSFASTYSDEAALSVTQGATVDDGGLTTLTGVDVTLDGTGTLAVGHWTSLTNGSLKITGGDYAPTSGAATSANSFAKLSDIDGSSIYVYGNGSLTLPAVNTYTNNNYEDGYLEAYQPDVYSGTPTVGVLSLPNLTTISGEYVQVLASGTGSEIDLPALTSFDLSYGSALSVTNGATVDDGGLTTLTGVAVTLDGTGKLAVSQWTSLTNGSLSITGGDYAPTAGAATSANSFAQVSDIDDSSIYVYGNGSLTLPAVDSYTDNNYGYDYLQAYQPNPPYGQTPTVGVLSLPNLTSISGEYVQVLASGTGSEIDLPALTSFDLSYGGALSVTNGATVDDSSLTSLTGVAVTLDGTGKLAVSQWTSLTNGSLSITGGDYAPTAGAATSANSFAQVSDIDDSSIYVYGGGSLTLPAVDSYTENNYNYEYLQAYQPNPSYEQTPTVGVLSLPDLTSISGEYVQLLASGTGSEIDLPALTSFDLSYGGTLSVTNGATVDDSSLTSLTGVAVTLDGTGKLAVSQWTSLTGGSLSITGGDYAPPRARPPRQTHSLNSATSMARASMCTATAA